MADKSFLQDMITSISERGRGLVGLAFPTPHARHDMVKLSDPLLSGRGEASGVALASEILETFEDSTEAERIVYLEALADQFGPDVDRLEKAARAFLKSQSPSSVRELTEAAEPRRQELIRRLNLAPGGTAALVRMREEVLKHLAARPQLADLDIDFEHLFSSWFNRGFLVLRRIDWTTPANILAKIIKYEAVHTIKSWEDLRARLEPPDRRCYAFFHPQLLDEPLIFVEVALTKEIPGAIAPLLEIEREFVDPRQATTAVFYSISNCQKGLRGVSFGNFLIKQVVEELKRDLLELKTFVTLSPVPGFAPWLKSEMALQAKSSFDDAERKALAEVVAPGWAGFGEKPGKAREALQAAAAAYFLAAKTSSGKPVDAVARFHLGNGARLERINVDGDLSAKGVAQAAGLMVNYLYDLAQIETNHEAFANGGQIVASSAVKKLLKADLKGRALLPKPNALIKT